MLRDQTYIQTQLVLSITSMPLDIAPPPEPLCINLNVNVAPPTSVPQVLGRTRVAYRTPVDDVLIESARQLPSDGGLTLLPTGQYSKLQYTPYASGVNGIGMCCWCMQLNAW